MVLSLDPNLTDGLAPPSNGSEAGRVAWDYPRPARGARLRLAQELHDQAGWHIAALNYGLFAAERDPGNPEKLKEVRHRLNALNSALRELTEQTRTRSRSGNDLPKTLAALCHCWTDVSGIGVDFDAGPLGVHPSVEISRALVAIAREALTNVAKHASAAHRVTVVLRAQGTDLLLEVADDGPGLDPIRTNAGHGNGLRGMRERVAFLGGALEIAGGPHGGARVTALVPRRSMP